MSTRKSFEETLQEQYEIHPSERQIAKENEMKSEEVKVLSNRLDARHPNFGRRSDHELGIIAQAKYLQTAIDGFRDGAITLEELRQEFAAFLNSTGE